MHRSRGPREQPSCVSHQGKFSLPPCRAARQQPLQQQATVLTQQVWDQHTLHASQAAIAAGVAALTASKDFEKIQEAFQEVHEQALGVGTAYSAAPAPVSSSTKSGSGWGFALRQPRGAGQPRQPHLPQQPGSQVWQWDRVQRFTALGLGSIGVLLHGAGPKAGPPPPRLAFRLFQLVLASALHQTLLTQLAAPPLAYDPEFDDLDRELLASLGFTVPDAEPSLAVGGQALLYMPCCPRQLYSDVLAANWGHLERLVILGTSMSSHADTQPLLAALAGSGGYTGQTAAASSLAAGLSRTNMGAAQLQLQQPSLLPGSDAVAVAMQHGRVVEVVCPDCAAHGVGVSVHMFRRQSSHARATVPSRSPV